MYPGPMIALLLACSTEPAAPPRTTVTGPGYTLQVPPGLTEVVRQGARLDLADIDGSPTVRIDEPGRLPLSPDDLMEDAVRQEMPDPLTLLSVGTQRGRTIFTVLKAASEDGPWIQATCSGRPEDSAVMESICTSLRLDAPAPPTRHPLPGLPLTIKAPHAPQPDGAGIWRFLPEGLELSVLSVQCEPLNRAPSEAALAELVGPYGESEVIQLTNGLAVLTGAASGSIDAVAELGDTRGSWQCQCSSADHHWRQRQALSLCESLEVVP